MNNDKEMKLMFLCEDCGEGALEMMGMFYWDYDTQNWETDGPVFGSEYCSECGEGINFREVWCHQVNEELRH